MAKKQTVIRLWSECDNKQIVGTRQVTYGTELLHENTHFLCIKPPFLKVNNYKHADVSNFKVSSAKFYEYKNQYFGNNFFNGIK